MKIERKTGIFEVRHDNHHLVGTIKWDDTWDIWCFYPTGIFSAEDLRQIAKFMERLR